MNYERKFYELINAGYSINEIAENIYLNYNSYDDVDLIYKIKKQISQKYFCSLNSIKLIGSSHTGYSVVEQNLVQKAPKDYDFAIIDTGLFIKYFEKTNISQIADKRKYIGNFVNGKIHPYYETKDIKDELDCINEKIEEELKLDRHLTICFYLSEKAFINGLGEYLKEIYVRYLNQFREIEKVSNTSVGKPLSKITD